MKTVRNQDLHCTKLHRNFLQIALVLVVLALQGTAMQAADTPHANARWMDTRLSPDRRADLVIQQMTLDEKIQMLHGSMAMHWQELGLKHPIPEHSTAMDLFPEFRGWASPTFN